MLMVNDPKLKEIDLVMQKCYLAANYHQFEDVNSFAYELANTDESGTVRQSKFVSVESCIEEWIGLIEEQSSSTDVASMDFVQ